MNDDKVSTKSLAILIRGVFQMCAILVKLCHASDLEQMQTKMQPVLKKFFIEFLADNPIVAETPEHSKTVENFMYNYIPSVIAATYNPDKDVMLSKFHHLAELPQQELIAFAAKVATKQAQEQDHISEPNHS